MEYQSERHQEHTLQMLETAGREIMRGWHEEAGIPIEDLDPDTFTISNGDADFLNDLAELLTGEHMPSGYQDSTPEPWLAVTRGVRKYIEEVQNT